jgi:isocitrate dehydrogenase
MPNNKTITVIPGDGIGPEVVQSALDIIQAAGVNLTLEIHEAGAKIFKQGLPSGVPQTTIDSIKKNRIVLKGPLETPVGFGEKSANVTLRKLFETFGNIRPVRELPGVTTPYSGRNIDLVIVRENVEDLYAGIEHLQTPSVAQCLKLISHKGCEKIVRLGFEFAKSQGRKRVHCATKSNIMKFTEGLLKKTFEKIALEYPEIESSHIIVDNCAHQLVKKPEQFDVIITTNMNGDILSDLSSALIGGLGFAPSANLGQDIAIFEAVHGSAPKYAGKNVINPTAMILSAVLMLRHIQEFDAANAIEQAVIVTLESGRLTRDVVGDNNATSTTDYTKAIIQNLGKTSQKYPPRPHLAIDFSNITNTPLAPPKSRRVIGLDVFVESTLSPDVLGPQIEQSIKDLPVYLKMMSNRGTRVYPATGTSTDCVDQFRCRIMIKDTQEALDETTAIAILQKISHTHTWSHIEKLQEFDGALSFSKAQGED